MKIKIIIIVVVLVLAFVITGVIYYVKNVLTVSDKDGMIYKPDDYIQQNDVNNYGGGDV